MDNATDSISCTQMLDVRYFEGHEIERDYKSTFLPMSRDDNTPEIFYYRGLCLLNGGDTEQD